MIILRRIFPTGGLKLESLSNVPRTYMRGIEAFGLIPTTFVVLVGSSGLEPPTSRLSGVRSNHLSYEPISYFGVSRSLASFVSPIAIPHLRVIR